MTTKEWFIQRKLELDIGVSFMVVVNLALISLTASRILQDYLKSYFGISVNMPTIVGVLVISALMGTWFFGYLLDKKLKFLHHMTTLQNERNIQLTKALNNTELIIQMLGGKKDD